MEVPVTGDITVSTWEFQDELEDNVDSIVENNRLFADEINTTTVKGFTVVWEEDSNTINLTLTGNPSNEGVKGTNAFDTVKALSEAGYTISVTKGADTYTLTGTPTTDAGTVKNLIPGNGGSTVITVTIANDYGYEVVYTVNLTCNWE